MQGSARQFSTCINNAKFGAVLAMFDFSKKSRGRFCLQPFNSCFIIHCFMENIQKLLCVMQADFICACKNTRSYKDKCTKRPHHSKPFKCSSYLAKERCAVRTAHGIICRYNWIAAYTITMLVHKITRILKISRGLLANQNVDSEYNVL